MKTAQKIEIANRNLNNLDSEFTTTDEALDKINLALQCADELIDLQRIRIAELEEDNLNLVNKVEYLENQTEKLKENIRVIMNI